MRVVLNNFGAGDSSVVSGFVAPQIKLHFDYIESELRKSTWFAGDEFTAADIQMSFPLELVAMLPEEVESRPKLKEFIDRIHGRPAYKRALERGGTYDVSF
jgi:glutathione S-transferase